MPRLPVTEDDLGASYAEPKSFLSRVLDWFMDLITEYRVFKVPLLNCFVLLVYIVVLFKFILRFSQLHSVSSFFATMLTNLLLLGLADTIAQTLRSVAAFTHNSENSVGPGASELSSGPGSLFRLVIEKGRSRRVILDEADDDLVDLGLALPQPDEPPPGPLTHPEIFNFRRLALFSAWGMIVTCWQFPWYRFLNGTWGDGPRFISILQRVLVDQLFYTPISLCLFLFYLMRVIEGLDTDAIRAKLPPVYFRTLATNYTIWPAAQFVNFMLIPHSLQIPFSATISVFWNAYLSLKNPS